MLKRTKWKLTDEERYAILARIQCGSKILTFSHFTLLKNNTNILMRGLYEDYVSCNYRSFPEVWQCTSTSWACNNILKKSSFRDSLMYVFYELIYNSQNYNKQPKQHIYWTFQYFEFFTLTAFFSEHFNILSHIV
jgi:hypothetical protein